MSHRRSRASVPVPPVAVVLALALAFGSAVAPVPAWAQKMATVLGQPIHRNDLGAVPPQIMQMAQGDTAAARMLTREWESQSLDARVLGTLLENYRRSRNLDATPAEVSRVLAASMRDWNEVAKEAKSLPPKPDTAAAEVRELGAGMVRRHKVNKALYQQYGGRVSFEAQSGAVPVDAYRRFLEAEQKKGTFTIEPAYKERFWAYFTQDKYHRFVTEAQAKELMLKPWWESTVPKSTAGASKAGTTKTGTTKPPASSATTPKKPTSSK